MESYALLEQRMASLEGRLLALEEQEKSRTGTPYFNIVSTEAIAPIATRVHGLLSAAGHNFGYVPVKTREFADGSLLPRLESSIRYSRVYLFHSHTHPDVNTAHMHLKLLLDSVKGAGPEHVTLVMPYVGYIRQDRKGAAREPISARVIANDINNAGVVGRFICLDLHYEQFPSLLNMPVDHLEGDMIFGQELPALFDNDYRNLVVMALDGGAQKRNRRLWKRMNREPGFGNYEKLEREEMNVARLGNWSGVDLSGKHGLSYEDMVDTAGTVCEAAADLKRRGLKSLSVAATHAVLSFKDVPALQKLRDAGVHLYTTDSIAQEPDFAEANADCVTVFPTAPLFARAIYENSILGGSVSKLFKSLDFRILKAPSIVRPW